MNYIDAMFILRAQSMASALMSWLCSFPNIIRKCRQSYSIANILFVIQGPETFILGIGIPVRQTLGEQEMVRNHAIMRLIFKLEIL